MSQSTEAGNNWQRILPYIDGLAHTELYTAGGLVITTSEIPLDAQGVMNELAAAQGANPAWTGEDFKTHYLDSALQSSGIAVRTRTPEGKLAWLPEGENRELSLALGGLFGQWGLDNPAIPARRILPSLAAQGSAARNDYAVFRTVLGYDDIPEITTILTAESRQKQLHRLQLGTLVRDTAERPEEDQLKLRILEMPKGQRPGSVEFEAIIAATREFKPGDVVSLEELVDVAKYSTLEDINKEAIEAQILRYFRDQTNRPRRRSLRLPLVALEGSQKSDEASLDGLTIHPDLAEPIKQMVDGVERLAQGLDVAEHAAVARKIVGDAHAMKALISKWVEFSPLLGSRNRTQVWPARPR